MITIEKERGYILQDPRRAGDVLRYHTWPHVQPQTVAHHSWNIGCVVAMFSKRVTTEVMVSKWPSPRSPRIQPIRPAWNAVRSLRAHCWIEIASSPAAFAAIAALAADQPHFA